MLSERAGRRDEPTTTLESVIGDDGDVGEGRHCATAAACNLPSRRSVRDCLAAAAGLSVEAEARAFIITVGWTGRLFNQREEGEHTQLAHSPMKEKKKKKRRIGFSPSGLRCATRCGLTCPWSEDFRKRSARRGRIGEKAR